MINENIRNIAIIAHVDHGKTSLVNELLKQGGVFRSNQEVQDRVMDSGAIERERGITITAKNTSCSYKGVKINIIDTPGHADFGGEVERVLKMTDGVILVVDAFEGPMPQTRFVLEKALALNLKVIIVINKIDKADQRALEVVDEVLELLMELDATDEQLDSPVVFCSARLGIAKLHMEDESTNMNPLFDTILSHIPAPQGDEKAPLQMLISSTEMNDFLGKLSVGKITRGTISVNQPVTLCNYHDPSKKEPTKVVSLFEFQGLKRVPVQTACVGDIVLVAGASDVNIGDTLCASQDVTPLPFVKISEPSVEMTFLVNDSPFAGKEGKFVTSRHLRERLYKETQRDLSLKVEDGETTEQFKVRGRGEMHLSILIENMRREGYEFQVSQPRVLYKMIDGVKNEPMDRLVIDVPADCVGVVMDKMGRRKGELLQMHAHNDRMRLEFKIPSRGIFGYKSEFLTDTKGEGIMSSVQEGYEPYKGDIIRRTSGSLIAFEAGDAIQYGLFNAQMRGVLFIDTGTPVYEGMIVGFNPKGEDLVVNVCKKKHLSNCRSSASDEALRLTPITKPTLEESLEFIADDELLEVTPKSIRMRKMILSHSARMKLRARKESVEEDE
jgi:GTP-binding protein